MSIEDNIVGRQKADAALELLMADLQDCEVRAAMAALRAHADSILGHQAAQDAHLSSMSEPEAKAFRAKTCPYNAYNGTLWRDVPRSYIETIADFGLELQRYLRSDLGRNHA